MVRAIGAVAFAAAAAVTAVVRMDCAKNRWRRIDKRAKTEKKHTGESQKIDWLT